MMGKHQLYVIPFSHFCEAARWALRACGAEFDENRALPGLHRLLFPSKDGSGDKVTPFVRLSDGGGVLGSSWEILEWSGRETVPSDVKDVLDRDVGPAIRSVFYSYSLDHPSFDTQVAQASFAQRMMWAVAGPKIKSVLRQLMVKDEEYVEKQKEALETGWQTLQERLQGEGNPFRTLGDGKPNAPCIALCAIAGAILMPDNRYGNVIAATPIEQLPEGLQLLMTKYRDTPLGEFILKTYKDQRML